MLSLLQNVSKVVDWQSIKNECTDGEPGTLIDTIQTRLCLIARELFVAAS